MLTSFARVLTALIACIGLASACAPPNSEAAAPTGLKDPGWLAAAQRDIATREYEPSENGSGLQAPNRAHDLRTYFEKTGIRVHDRTAEGSPELLELSLAGVGRDGAIEPIQPGALLDDESRARSGRQVRLRRSRLTEWYVNSPKGLEQGFTLDARPEGRGPVVLELTVMRARASLRGDAVIFDTGQRKLRYGELAAADADGIPLAARFELASADRVRIVVDDERASYPVVIDPLLTGIDDAQLESNQATAGLGLSVAGAGDVNGDGYADVIVGAYLFDNGQADEGAAFIFRGSATGMADSNPATAGVALLESNQASALLGSNVAAAGDVNGDGYGDVIVGARLYDNGTADEGAAFIFLGSATGIANGNPGTAATILESNQTPTPSFPASLASAGDVNGDGFADVIVGADSYDNGQSDEGAAFLFLGSSTGVANGNPATAATVLEGNQGNGRFGFSVDGAGDVNGDGFGDVIAGAWLYSAGQTQEGAAFVFLGSATGIPNSNPATPGVAQLESNQVAGELGISVAGAGDVNGDGYSDVIVGALDYAAGQSGEGAAFVFRGSATGIASSNPATAGVAQLETNQASAQLGSVAGAGDVNGDGYADVIVGSRSYDDGQSNEGAAWVFLGSSSGIANGNPATAWAQLEANQASADFGVCVAGAGDVNGDGYADVVVGAQLYDSGQADEGAAFVYLGGGTGIVDGSPLNAGTRLEANQSGALLGSSVAGAGDVNGDGYSDVIVGAREYDAGQGDEGAAFVFLGSATGVADGNPGTAPTQLESDQGFAGFGFSVAGAGDVNGDGYGDVIVGSPFFDAGNSDEGAAFVFLGSATGIADANPSTAAAQLESNQDAAYFGLSVAPAGDVNGDGYPDVIVGSPAYDNGQSDEGAAFVFRGSPSGIADGNPASAGVARLESDQGSAVLGTSVAGAGDVNGDGYADVIVSALLLDRAYVFHGTASGIANGNPATADAVLGPGQGLFFGGSVAGAGDTNADGYADVIVGCVGCGSIGAEGAAYVFRGSSTGIADSTYTTPGVAALESDQPNAAAGPSDPHSIYDVLMGASGAGDVNGDGYADVIVGFAQYDAGQTDEGAAFVFLGTASGIASAGPATAAAQLESNQASAYFGFSVAPAGDVNGDGFADVIAGAARGTAFASTVYGGYTNGHTFEGGAFVFLGNGTKGRPVLARQRRGDGSSIAVQPWGLSQATSLFTAELRANHPQGTGRVKAQFEACQAGVPFGNGSCTNVVTPSWVTVNGTTPEVVLAQSPLPLTPNVLYHWRARILHAPKTGAIPTNPAHGPWRRFGAQSEEADIRLPEPTLLLSIASGVALLAALARRKPKLL